MSWSRFVLCVHCVGFTICVLVLCVVFVVFVVVDRALVCFVMCL